MAIIIQRGIAADDGRGVPTSSMSAPDIAAAFLRWPRRGGRQAEIDGRCA
jgi:hypothetical protein